MTIELPVTRSCAECRYGRRTPWKDVLPRRLAIIDRLRRRRGLDAGTALFRQGGPSEGLHCISRGVFGISITHRTGTDVMIRLAYPGDTLGARAFLRDAPHRTTAVALTDAAVCTLARGDALQLTQDAPEVHRELVGRCLDEMGRAEASIVEQACLPNRARLCRLLADLLEQHGERRGASHVARLPVSRGSMAAMLGIQPESLSRLFSRLRADGLIALSGRHVSTDSLSALKVEAGGATPEQGPDGRARPR